MSNLASFASGFGRLPGKRQGAFGAAPVKLPPLDRGALTQFWHPDRAGVEPAPEAVARALTAIHPKLRACKPPAGAPIHTGYHPWIVWFEEPTIRHSLCPGWLLLFIWENPDTHEPLPLDNRLYANCYMRDPRRFTNGVEYFEKCVSVMDKETAARKAITNQETFDRQKGLRDYQKIKNIGSGSKFPLHHDGANIASRGETNWRTDTLYQRLPDEVRQMAEKEGKNTRKRVGLMPNTDMAFIRERENFSEQIDMLKMLRDRREKVNAKFSRSTVGYTGTGR